MTNPTSAQQPEDAERLAKIRAGRLSPRWLDDIEFLLRQIEERDAKYKRDHKQLCDVMYRERDALRATIAEQARRLAQMDRVVRAAATCRDRFGVTEELYRELAALDDPRPTPATSGETPPDFTRWRGAFKDMPDDNGWPDDEPTCKESLQVHHVGDTAATAAPQPPADLMERAREYAGAYLDSISGFRDPLEHTTEHFAAALAAERADATRRAIEIAEDEAKHWPPRDEFQMPFVTLLNRLRALSPDTTEQTEDAERLAKIRAGRLSPRWLDDIEFLLRQIEERDATIAAQARRLWSN